MPRRLVIGDSKHLPHRVLLPHWLLGAHLMRLSRPVLNNGPLLCANLILHAHCFANRLRDDFALGFAHAFAIRLCHGLALGIAHAVALCIHVRYDNAERVALREGDAGLLRGDEVRTGGALQMR